MKKGLLILITAFIVFTSLRPKPRSVKFTYGFKLYDSITEIKGSNKKFKVLYDDQPIYYKHYPTNGKKEEEHVCFYSWLMYSYDQDFIRRKQDIQIIKLGEKEKFNDTMFVRINFPTDRENYGITEAFDLDTIMFIPDHFIINAPVGKRYWEDMMW